MFFVVLEIQNAGTPAVLTDAFTESAPAYAKYYTILAAAAVSSVPYHAAYIIGSNGIMLEGKVFDRTTNTVVVE